MSSISNYYSNVVSSGYANDIQNANAKGAKDVREQPNAGKADKADKSDKSDAKQYVGGRTIGNPQLSEKAQKYYEQLKKKFNNMDFVLVSEDQKEAAKAQASSFANKNRMVVLVDEAKIEKMAEDEEFREQYEGIIRNAATGMNDFKNAVSATGANVKGYGMQVNDNGTTSYFAVLEKSADAQSKRIEEKRAANKAAKKAEAKKAQKQENEERIKERRDKGKTDTADKAGKSDDTVITANSIDELIQKLQDHVQAARSDEVMTEGEKNVGQHIDFSA